MQIKYHLTLPYESECPLWIVTASQNSAILRGQIAPFLQISWGNTCYSLNTQLSVAHWETDYCHTRIKSKPNNIWPMGFLLILVQFFKIQKPKLNIISEREVWLMSLSSVPFRSSAILKKCFEQASATEVFAWTQG